MKPVFEFEDGDRHYKVFADGRVEGGEKIGRVINRVAPLLHYAQTSAKQLGHQSTAATLAEFGG